MKKPWSFSSLNTFETCGAMYHAKYVAMNYVEPPQQHLIHGTTTHAHLEARMRDGVPLPQGYEHHEVWCEVFDRVPRISMLVEEKMGLTRDLQPTGFDSPDVWWRGVIDLAMLSNNTAIIADWKTSKSAKPDFTQLNLFSAAVFAKYPEILSVKQVFVWLKLGKRSSEVFSRDDLGLFWEKMIPRVARLEQAWVTDCWFEKPSGLCREHCFHSTCQYRGRGRR